MKKFQLKKTCNWFTQTVVLEVNSGLGVFDFLAHALHLALLLLESVLPDVDNNRNDRGQDQGGYDTGLWWELHFSFFSFGITGQRFWRSLGSHGEQTLPWECLTQFKLAKKHNDFFVISVNVIAKENLDVNIFMKQ